MRCGKVKGPQGHTGFGQYNQVGPIWESFLIKEDRQFSIPHSATTLGRGPHLNYKKKKYYQQNQRKNRPL
jgi:hypothetical protein